MLTLNEIVISGASPDYVYYGYGYENVYGSGQFSNNNTLAFVLFTSCWTFTFVLYLILTSVSAHTRTDKPIGRFFSEKIALAVDFLSVVFWFAAFIAFAQSIGVAACGDGPDVSCGLVVTNIVVAICAWYGACPGTCMRYLLTDRQHHLYRNHSLGCALHDSYPQRAFRETRS